MRLHALDYGGPCSAIVILPGITMPAIGMDFVPDAGHMVFWDNPGPALDVAREALAHCSAGPGR